MIRKRRDTLALLLAAAGVLLGPAPQSAQAQVRLRTIAATGDPIPGEPANVTYVNLGTTSNFKPLINNRGDVLMVPSITTPTGELVPRSIVLVSAAGSARVLARVGDLAVSQPAGVIFFSLFPPVLNNNGDVGFSARLIGGGLPASGAEALYFVRANGSPPRLLLTTNDPVPGIEGATFVTLSGTSAQHDLSLTGHTLQVVNITGGSTIRNDQTLLIRLAPDGLAGYEQLARSFTQAPLLPAGVRFHFASPFSQYKLTESGAAVFSGLVLVPGTVSRDDQCIWLFPPNGAAPVLLVRSGEAAPGLSGPLVDFSDNRISPNGHMALFLGLTGTGIGDDNDRCIVVIPPDLGAPRVVMREGHLAPGFPENVPVGTVYGGGFNYLDVNSLGQTVYRINAGGGVPTAEDMGIISEARGVDRPQLVAREGQQAPGCPAEVRFAESVGAQAPSFAINDAGHTAFVAPLSGTGVTTADNFGIWLVDPDGFVHLVVRTGDQINVSDLQPPKTIRFLVTGGDAFEPKTSRRWLNNSGEVVFTASFTDNTSAVFVASLPRPCRADFNHVDGVTHQDLLDYLEAWFALLPAADINGTGGVTLQDLFDYLAFWFAGC